MFVEIMHEMELIMPTLAVRIHKNTPSAFIEKTAEVLRYGRGEPIIYNDEAIIPGFLKLGIPIETARGYSNDGCWETLIPGESHFSYAHVLNPRCIEWVLNRGVSQHNMALEGVDTGAPEAFETFEAFYNAYTVQTNHYIDMQCRTRLDNYGLSSMIAPDPLMSSILDDCVDKGSDISRDGAKYVFHQILITGLSTAVDSLFAIKELVYEKGTLSLGELADILAANWAGHETLRAEILNKIPKFGNDIDAVDELAIRMLDDFASHVDAWNEQRKRILFVSGIGTFENYAALGRDIGASADGRYKGDALAPNYSPSPGADIAGPTAAIKSITKPDLLRYYSGSPLDLAINSTDVEGEAGIHRLAGLIRGFCKLGGQILTLTSNNVEDLKDAKVNPERHRSLMVRLGGLSAYFVSMSPVQQDNIIKRFSR
jgi:formate C-acetyltransferase